MRNLLRLIFLICLLVPLAANGQKRIYMPSIGGGFIKAPSACTRSAGFLLATGTIGCSYGMGSPQLIVLNPERKLGSYLTYVHRASIYPFTGYSFGIASSGRHHFVVLSAGPDLSIPGYSTDTDARHSDSWRVGFQGQAGAFVMPLRFLGLGMFLYYKPALHGKPAGRGVSFDLMFRIGWK